MITNVVIFGTGLFYSRRKYNLPKQTNIIAFIDNDITIQGKSIDDISVFAPSAVLELNYDIIILASNSAIQMRNQLISMGVLKEKIIFWEQFVSSKSHGIIKKYGIDQVQKGHKILILVPVINFAGGFMTALYAALALKSKGYYIVIAAPTANNETLLEVKDYGINIWICPALPYIEEVEMKWILDFDYVLVNSLQNMICVDKIKSKKSVIWWLHEHSRQYKDIIEQYGFDIDFTMFNHNKTLAVSEIAKNNFLKYYPKFEISILTLGLPDFYIKPKYPHKKIIFTIIGNISELKNQKELVNAIKMLSLEEICKIECWIIGRDGGKKYREELEEMIKNIDQIKIVGEKSRKEMERIFQQVDIVVCTSLEETMSISIIEGLMNKKICITNTNTGIANFIENNKNGLIYEANNVNDLKLKIKYTIQNFDSLNYIREKARSTYLKFFSMEIFANNLQQIIKESNLVCNNSTNE